MGLLVIIPFGALAAWIIFRIFRWLRRGDYGPEWWRVFRILTLAGVLLGLWLVFSASYNVANIHLDGFPIPIRIASREKPDGPWVNSNLPALLRVGAGLTDFLYGVAACLAPIAAAAFIRENRGTKDFSGVPRDRETP